LAWVTVCGLHRHAKFYPFGLVNVGKNIAENGILWYKFAPKGYINLTDFYNICLKMEPQNRTLVPNFTAVALKMPKIAQNCNFC